MELVDKAGLRIERDGCDVTVIAGDNALFTVRYGLDNNNMYTDVRFKNLWHRDTQVGFALAMVQVFTASSYYRENLKFTKDENGDNVVYDYFVRIEDMRTREMESRVFTTNRKIDQNNYFCFIDSIGEFLGFVGRNYDIISISFLHEQTISPEDIGSIRVMDIN